MLSRVVRLRFEAPDLNDVQRILQVHGVIDNAKVLAALAGGSPGRALAFKEAGIFDLRHEALALLQKLPLQNPFGHIAGLGWGDKYDRAAALLLTEQFVYLLRDILLLQSGAADKIYNTEHAFTYNQAERQRGAGSLAEH